MKLKVIETLKKAFFQTGRAAPHISRNLPGSTAAVENKLFY